MNRQLSLSFEGQAPPPEIWSNLPAESRRQVVQAWAEVMLRTRRRMADPTNVGQVPDISHQHQSATAVPARR